MDRQEMKQKKMMGAILPGNSTVELENSKCRSRDMDRLWSRQWLQLSAAVISAASNRGTMWEKVRKAIFPELWQVMNLVV